MLIQIISIKHFLSTNLKFLEDHLTHDHIVQRLIKRKEKIRTISFIESLSLQQDEEDKIFNDHFLIIVIKNDMTKILLNLFIS